MSIPITNKSITEIMMDTLEKNFINGFISEKEYDNEMDALIQEQNNNNNSARWNDRQWDEFSSNNHIW